MDCKSGLSLLNPPIDNPLGGYYNALCGTGGGGGIGAESDELLWIRLHYQGNGRRFIPVLGKPVTRCGIRRKLEE